MKRIVFDIETQKLFSEIKNKNNIWDLLMSTCVTYCFEDDEYKFWTYLTKDSLLEYLNGNMLIGFNSINFDLRVLLGPDTVIHDDFTVSSQSKNFKCSNYDIYLNVHRAISNSSTYSSVIEFMKKNRQAPGLYSLDGIAISTLGNSIKKNGKGELAPDLFKAKKVVELFQYNLQDVRVTKKVYEFILRYKYVVNGNYDIIKL